MRHGKQRLHRGLTIIEVTLVIAVLLGLISALFIGVNSYKEGSNRAICIQNIANAQKAVRSFSNLNEVIPGAEVAGLRSKIYGPNCFLPVEPTCPSKGEYSYLEDEMPQLGTHYLTCSIETHLPAGNAIW